MQTILVLNGLDSSTEKRDEFKRANAKIFPNYFCTNDGESEWWRGENAMRCRERTCGSSSRCGIALRRAERKLCCTTANAQAFGVRERRRCVSARNATCLCEQSVGGKRQAVENRSAVQGAVAGSGGRVPGGGWAFAGMWKIRYTQRLLPLQDSGLFDGPEQELLLCRSVLSNQTAAAAPRCTGF